MSKTQAPDPAQALPPPDAVAGYFPPAEGYAFAKETFRISEWMRPQTERHEWKLEFYSRATVERLLAEKSAAIPAPEGALRKVAQEVLERCDAYLERDDVPTCLEAIRSLEALRDVLAAPPIPAPEFNSSPFAWARWSTAGLGPDIMVGSIRPDGEGWFSVHARFDDMPPLAAPAPHALTEEQIDAITLEQWGECSMMSPDARRKWSRLLARAIERAHGIPAPKEPKA